jgi:glycosyltransferase involved in cell wall biosynthesis
MISSARSSDVAARGRILVVTYYYKPLFGGLQTQLRMLVHHLAQNGFAVKVITSRPSGTPADENTRGIRIQRFGDAATLTGLRSVYQKARAILSAEPVWPTVVYMPLGVGTRYPVYEQINLLNLCAARGLPVVVRITSSGRVSEFAKGYRGATAAIRRVHAVVSLNPGITQELIQIGVPQERIFQTANGVDTLHFCPKPSSIKRDSSERLRFLAVCRFSEKKQLPALLTAWRAFAQARMSYDDVELYVVGGDNMGTEDSALCRRVRSLASEGRIMLSGPVEHAEMPEHYRASDVYVSLSTQEGMSNATLEAMSCALPVVVPCHPVYDTLVETPPNWSFADVSDLIATLNNVVVARATLRSRGRQNRLRAKAQYSQGPIMRRYAELFDRVAFGRRDLQ